ncbi:MAG TPA: acyl carrier protein [Urbifossiella sp.]|jgi:acyl carrier protein|nr:acyl carrier protein [Urbifossiella sp.]
MADIAPRLQTIFRDVFDDPTLTLRDEMTAADVDGWDSLNHVNLVIAIERAIGVKFAMAEISKMKEPGQNVGSLIRLIETKAKANH